MAPRFEPSQIPHNSANSSHTFLLTLIYHAVCTVKISSQAWILAFACNTSSELRISTNHTSKYHVPSNLGDTL